MAVGKGSILRASNVKTKLEEEKTSSVVKPAVRKETESSPLAAGVPISEIETFSGNEVDGEAIQELVSSIEKYGMIVPVTVWQKSQNHFVVIDGEKRLAAARILGMEQIFVHVTTGMTRNQAQKCRQEIQLFFGNTVPKRHYEVVSAIRGDMPAYLL